MRRSSHDSADATGMPGATARLGTRNATSEPSDTSDPRDEDARPLAALGARGRRLDPLWIMLAVGGVLFGLEMWRSPRRDDEIVLTRERIAASETTLRRALGRDPTPSELDASLMAHVDAEIAVREARRLGLDRDDPIVRRRLVQKIEQILESTWDDRAPTQAEIDAWIAANPDRYRNEATLDLTHAFVAARAGEDPTTNETPMRVLAIRTALIDATDGDPAAALSGLVDAGDAFVHGARLRGQSRAAIVAKFGEHFAEALFADDGDPGRTQPSADQVHSAERWRIVASRHGWHVVTVEERREAKGGTRDVVAGQAARDWLEAQRDATREAERTRLRGHYRVVREGDS